VDAIAILSIVVLNAVIGFYQEFNAEKSIAALKKMTAPQAKVRRDGQVTVVPASAIVAGDILALEAGDLVAADAGCSKPRSSASSHADRRVGGGKAACDVEKAISAGDRKTWFSWARAWRQWKPSLSPRQ
jgi:Ca2+-transporting ATPase